MEQLQDAIEDAQYMTAMHDDMPRPTKEWQWPTAEELKSFLDQLKAANPKIFEAEGICKGSLGFYLVRRAYPYSFTLSFHRNDTIFIVTFHFHDTSAFLSHQRHIHMHIMYP